MMKNKSAYTTKWTALFLCFCLIPLQNFAYAGEAYEIQTTDHRLQSTDLKSKVDHLLSDLNIPLQLGTVEEVYFTDKFEEVTGTRSRVSVKPVAPILKSDTDNSPSTTRYPMPGPEFLSSETRHPSPVSRVPKTIIYIQDAHDSLEAQENIAQMIDRLVEQNGVKTVYEEGYEGTAPTDELFEEIGDRELRRKVSYFFMDQLRLGGAEYSHINRTHDFKLVGADNIRRHLANIRWYQKSARYQKNAAEDLNAALGEVRQLVQQYFPKPLKHWIEQREKFESKQYTLPDHLRNTAGLFLEFSPEEVLAERYPLSHLILTVGATRNPEALEGLKNLDARVLFTETERMEKEVVEHLITSARDRRLFLYYRILNLLKRLMHIELTQQEYEAVRQHLRSFKTERLAGFIARQTHKPIVLSRLWEQMIQDAIQFYETAKSRDNAVSLALDEFAASGEQTAVLVFGGFHRSNLREIFRRKGFNYAVISPRISQVSERHQNYYKELMSTGHYGYEIPAVLSHASRPAPLLDLPARKQLLRAVRDGYVQFPDMDPRLMRRHLETENLAMRPESRHDASNHLRRGKLLPGDRQGQQTRSEARAFNLDQFEQRLKSNQYQVTLDDVRGVAESLDTGNVQTRYFIANECFPAIARKAPGLLADDEVLETLLDILTQSRDRERKETVLHVLPYVIHVDRRHANPHVFNAVNEASWDHSDLFRAALKTYPTFFWQNKDLADEALLLKISEIALQKYYYHAEYIFDARTAVNHIFTFNPAAFTRPVFEQAKTLAKERTTQDTLMGMLPKFLKADPFFAKDEEVLSELTAGLENLYLDYPVVWLQALASVVRANPEVATEDRLRLALNFYKKAADSYDKNAVQLEQAAGNCITAFLKTGHPEIFSESNLLLLFEALYKNIRLIPLAVNIFKTFVIANPAVVIPAALKQMKDIPYYHSGIAVWGMWAFLLEKDSTYVSSINEGSIHEFLDHFEDIVQYAGSEDVPILASSLSTVSRHLPQLTRRIKRVMEPVLEKHLAGYSNERLGIIEALKAYHRSGSSKPFLIPLGAKLNPGELGRKKTASPTMPKDLARWIFENRSSEEVQEMQVSVGYDTGIFLSQEDRGKFIALFLQIATTVLGRFQALDPLPQRDPNAAFGPLIRGDEVVEAMPGQRKGYRLDFVFNLPVEMTEQELAEFLEMIQMLSTGMLLASTQETYQTILPDKNPDWFDSRMQAVAEEYREFERNLVALLREFDAYRDPDQIYLQDDGQDEIRRAGFQKFRLEESLYPTYQWLTPLYAGDSEAWPTLLPVLQGTIEAMELHQGEVEGGDNTVGQEFIERTMNVGKAAYLKIIQRMQQAPQTDSPKSVPRNPLIDSRYEASTRAYLQATVNELAAGYLDPNRIPDRKFFDDAVRFYQIVPGSSRSELREMESSEMVLPVKVHRETVPKKAPRKVPNKVPPKKTPPPSTTPTPEKKPEPKKAPVPAPVVPQPAPKRPPRPSPFRPAPAPHPAVPGRREVSPYSPARAELRTESVKQSQIAIGNYSGTMKGSDALVFTGGIGSRSTRNHQTIIKSRKRINTQGISIPTDGDEPRQESLSALRDSERHEMSTLSPSGAETSASTAPFPLPDIQLPSTNLDSVLRLRERIKGLSGRFAVTVDLADYAAFDEAQRQEYEKMLLQNKNISFALYNGAKSIDPSVRRRLEWLQEKLGADRVIFSSQGTEEVISKYAKLGKVIHLSKAKDAQELKALVRFSQSSSNIYLFRYLGDEIGLLTAALLLADGENPNARGRVVDFNMIAGVLRTQITEYLASLSFASAA